MRFAADLDAAFFFAGGFRVRECASRRVVLDDAGFLDVCYFLHEHGFVHAEVRE